MSELTHTKIPTAYLFGEKNAYSWNPVRGCDNHSCPLHPQNKGGCWAARICNEWAGPWFKSEENYLNDLHERGKLRRLDWNYVVRQQMREAFDKFEPTWFQSQFDKKFPKKRSCILTGYQTDLAFVPQEWTERIIEKINENNKERESAGLPLHIFPFLTKAPGKLYPFFEWPGNCWLGFTATNKDEYNLRWIETFQNGVSSFAIYYVYLEPLRGEIKTSFNQLDWVIVGGGPDPLNPDWVRSIRDQCKKAGISFYFKGWSQWLPKWQYIEKEKNLLFAPMQSASHVKVSKKEAGNWIDGEKWEKFPEVENEQMESVQR